MILGLDYQGFWAIFVILMAFGLAALIVIGCVVAVTLVKIERTLRTTKHTKYTNDDLYDEVVQ
jgi:hypothetical protein